MIDESIPLVDLHRHLEGNIRPETIWELADRHAVILPAGSLQEFVPLTRVEGRSPDLPDFLKKLDFGVSVLADLDASYRVALENLEDARRDQLDYVELRFSPAYMAAAFGLPLDGVIEAVLSGVRDGVRRFGVRANLIGILNRSYGAAASYRELDSLLRYKDGIRALDLAGDERGFPAALFENHFRRARDAGLHITVHAGEADGPQSVWTAIKTLGATRIGHCVAAREDRALMEYLAKNQIAIEACPTSNYQTATVESLTDHPLKFFFENGLLVTLNTDDPAVSNIDLRHEYRVAHEIIGLSERQLSRIQENGLVAAFLSQAEQKEIVAAKREKQIAALRRIYG